MSENDLAYLIFLGLCVYLAHWMGKREGIEITLDYCKQQGKIDFEE